MLFSAAIILALLLPTFFPTESYINIKFKKYICDNI